MNLSDYDKTKHEEQKPGSLGEKLPRLDQDGLDLIEVNFFLGGKLYF